jgi:putative drug exporter of the RND superfamily
MTRFFDALGRFSVGFRWPILVVWLAGAVAATQLLPSLASAVDNDNTAFLPSDSPSVRAIALAAPFQRSDQAPVTIVASRADGPLTSADQDAVGHLVAAAQRVPDVAVARETGVSPDGRAAQVQVLANVSGFGSDSIPLVDSLRGAIRQANPPPGLQLHTAGPVATAVDNNRRSGETGNRTQQLSILFVLVLLLVVFRSVLAPLLTLLPALLVISVAGPLIAELARHGVLKVSEIAQLLLIILVIGAGTDYGLFLVFRVREELRAGLPPKRAVAHAVARVGESITFSAGTVIAAVLCLLLAAFGFYNGLAYPLGIGIAMMLLAGLTLLPALLAIFGRVAFWPSNVRPGLPRTGAWGRIAARVIRRPALTLVIGVVVFGALSVAALGYEPSGFGGASGAPEGSDSAAGNAALATHFPQAAANPTSLLLRLPAPVWERPQPVQAAERQLSGEPAFKSVIGPLDPTGTPLPAERLASLHAKLGPPQRLASVPPAGLLRAAGVTPAEYQVYRATGQFVSADGRTVQFFATLSAGDPSGTPALRATPAVRAALDRAAAAAGASDHGVAGQSAALYDISATSSSDLRRIVPVVVVVIGVLLALVLRSLVAPLYLIVSVLLSYLAALGLAVAVFIGIRGDEGLPFFLPFLMFLFLLALGEDYNILAMTRIREEAHHLPLRQAVTRAVNATGSTITSAGLVLAGSFGVLVVAAGNAPGADQVQAIGVGLALGVLMDTFLVRTLLIPSTVVLLGRLNWWPSRLGRPDQLPSLPPEPEPERAASAP